MRNDDELDDSYLNNLSNSDGEETNSHSENIVDLDDLFIIDNPSNWEPSKELIIIYAKDLGFNADNDPPHLLNIFKKYLKRPISENYIRAYFRENLHLLYININTAQIIYEMGFEEEAKKEYLKMKKELEEKNERINYLFQVNYYKEPDNYYDVDDLSKWEPPKECILQYAKKIGFDNNIDPPELLDKIKKYLLETPDNYKIIIRKSDNQILYINKDNYNISFTCQYEEEVRKKVEIRANIIY